MTNRGHSCNPCDLRRRGGRTMLFSARHRGSSVSKVRTARRTHEANWKLDTMSPTKCSSYVSMIVRASILAFAQSHGFRTRG